MDLLAAGGQLDLVIRFHQRAIRAVDHGGVVGLSALEAVAAVYQIGVQLLRFLAQLFPQRAGFIRQQGCPVALQLFRIAGIVDGLGGYHQIAAFCLLHHGKGCVHHVLLQGFGLLHGIALVGLIKPVQLILLSLQKCQMHVSSSIKKAAQRQNPRTA